MDAARAQNIAGAWAWQWAVCWNRSPLNPAAGVTEEDYYVQKIQQMQNICAVLVTEQQRQGLSESNDPFLVEQGLQVHDHISHAGLRATTPGLEKAGYGLQISAEPL